jgi:hypothetical protein
MVIGAALLFGDAVTHYIGPPQPLEPASEQAATTEYQETTPIEKEPTLEEMEAMTYDEFTPYFRKLLNSKNVRGTPLDTPSGWRSFTCVDIRKLRDPREKVAYLAMSKFSQDRHGYLLIPYVVSDTIPVGLWDHSEIREVMAPILEAAKQEYRGLVKSTVGPAR